MSRKSRQKKKSGPIDENRQVTFTGKKACHNKKKISGGTWTISQSVRTPALNVKKWWITIRGSWGFELAKFMNSEKKTLLYVFGMAESKALIFHQTFPVHFSQIRESPHSPKYRILKRKIDFFRSIEKYLKSKKNLQHKWRLTFYWLKGRGCTHEMRHLTVVDLCSRVDGSWHALCI